MFAVNLQGGSDVFANFLPRLCGRMIAADVERWSRHFLFEVVFPLRDNTPSELWDSLVTVRCQTLHCVAWQQIIIIIIIIHEIIIITIIIHKFHRDASIEQNFTAAMCHVLHYSCNVDAAVADSSCCRMICGTVPFSVQAWMPPATAATWSPAAAHSKPLPRQRERRDRQWSCATTVEHAATVTMQIADAYVTRCRQPTVAHCRDNVVLCRSYNGKLDNSCWLSITFFINSTCIQSKSQ